MSRMKLDRKPPLAKSPIRLRPRRSLRSNSSSMQTPPGSLTKSQVPSRSSWNGEESQLRPEYRSISSELMALARKLKDDFGNNESGFPNKINVNSSSPLFERGRFYEAYSARRNERLKRKKAETGDDDEDDNDRRKSTPYNLGVKVELSKRRESSSKKFESGRKSMSSVYSVVADRSQHPRYSLRSSSCKENKKPPLAVKFDKAVVEGDRKIGVGRVRKI